MSKNIINYITHIIYAHIYSVFHASFTIAKTVNLSLNEQLLNEARSYKMNMSKASENGIIEALNKAKTELCKKENTKALESSNDYVSKNGLPLAKHRQF